MQKHIQNFSFLVQFYWNSTFCSKHFFRDCRLLSPNVDYTSCHTSCWTTWDLALDKLGNFKEILKMFGTNGKVLSRWLKNQILKAVLKICKKIAVKHSRETLMLQHFVKCCLRKNIFISNSTCIPCYLHFRYILAFQKTYSLFKYIFKASE